MDFLSFEDTVAMPLHSGTHVDALCHAWNDDKPYNGYLGDTLRSTTGATRLGIDKMALVASGRHEFMFFDRCIAEVMKQIIGNALLPKARRAGQA